MASMAQGESVLVILDGDLTGLVAAACACEAAIGERSCAEPILWYSGAPGDDQPREAARRQAAHLGVPIIEHTLDPAALGLDEPGEQISGEIDALRSITLMIAGLRARAQGIGVVVCPDRAPTVRDHGDSVPDIDRAAAIADRAVLIERLVSLEGETASGVRIETPLADLTDDQVLDLALDLGVPLELCWWHSAQSGQSALESRRPWDDALSRIGLVEGAETPPLSRTASEPE